MIQKFMAFLLILILSPIFLILVLFTYINFGSPIIFKQKRVGKNSKIFTIYKFRTMIGQYKTNRVPLSDAERLTNFGKFIRKTSLDELPELLNILLGDMAFVGPRPLLVEYLPLYSIKHARRHEILPGITGYAQVNGRNLISWNKRFDMDVWYVDNRNIFLDIKIILLTFIKVFDTKSVSHENHPTMPFFEGSHKNNERD